MDVKCEKCGTEYEFDDEKVGEAGITVKCTHCGHLFRVVHVPETNVLGSSGDRLTPIPRPNHWMIRSDGGEIREFKDLSTLQQWIVERKVSRSDEISKTGESWKPLGSIIELSSFFMAVEGKKQRIVHLDPPADHNLTPSEGPAPPPPQSVSDLLDTGEFRLEGPGSTSRRLEPTMPVTSRTSGLGGAPVSVSAVPQGSSRPAYKPTYEPTGLDGPPPERRRDGNGFLLGVVATVALAGVGYFIYDQFFQQPFQKAPISRSKATVKTVQPAQSIPSAEDQMKLERAERGLSRGSDEDVSEADKIFEALLTKSGPGSTDHRFMARAYVGHARVATIRAEYDLLAEKTEAASRNLSTAELALANARALVPESMDMSLAYADFYRVKGDAEGTRRHLQVARRAGATIEQVGAIDAGVNLHVPKTDLSVVSARLEALPESIKWKPRIAYQRAVALVGAGQNDQAIRVLDKLVAQGGQTAAIQQLHARLGAHKVVTTKKVDVVAQVKPQSEPKMVAKPSPTAEEPSQGVVSGSFDGLMRRGYRLLEHGRAREARTYFQAAVKKRPRSPEAYSNLAWCELDMGRTRTAIRHFQKALDRSSRYADGLYGLGTAYLKSGNRSQAKVMFERYLQHYPRGRKAKIVQRKLERL